MPCIAHTYVGWTDEEDNERWVTVEVEVSPSTTATQIRDAALAQVGDMYASGGSPQLETLGEATVIEVEITDIFCY